MFTDIFLQIKKKGKRIIVFDFFFLFRQLNFLSLLKKKQKVINKTKLLVIKVIKLVKYKKANQSYLDRPKFSK